MTKHDLKELAAMGAELGAAKAENERLRGLLREAAKFIDTGDMRGLNMIEVHAALSHQGEPTDTYTAVDMATAAAQGFRDGQAAVEPAAVQDEREIIGVERYRVVRHGGNFGIACVKAGDGERTLYQGHISDCERVAAELATAFEDGKFVARRPAQTEQQPWDDSMVRDFLSVALRHVEVKGTLHSQDIRDALRYMAERYAAPIAQTATQGWKLVPVKLTQAMREAFNSSYERYEDGHGECPDSQWSAMLRAAPSLGATHE